MPAATQTARQTARRIEVDTKAWEALLDEYKEITSEKSRLDKRLEAIKEQVLEELRGRAGKEAQDGLALIDEERAALKDGSKEAPALDVVSVNQALQEQCRIVTGKRVAYIEAVPVMPYGVAGRVDLRLKIA